MQGPWEGNEIYTLRHRTRCAGVLRNVAPHCRQPTWDLEMREEERYHPIKGKECVQRHRGMGRHGHVRPASEAQGAKREITEEEVGSTLWETRNPMVCCHPHIATQEEASFPSPPSLTPQRSNKDKGTGWRNGNQPGHSRKEGVKPALPGKAEVKLVLVFLPEVQESEDCMWGLWKEEWREMGPAEMGWGLGT